MIRRPGVVAGAVLTAAVLASCSVGDDPAPAVPYPLDGLESACDKFGNRVHVRTLPREATLAVVGQDPTCPAVVSGSRTSGLDETVPADLESAVAT